MTTKTKKPKPVELTVDGYYRAVAIRHLSSIAHEQALLSDSLGADVTSGEFFRLHDLLHKSAEKVFPLYPHDGWLDAKNWLAEKGIQV